MTAMKTQLDSLGNASGTDTHDVLGELFDEVEVGATRRMVMPASGRRYELESGEVADRLIVRSRAGTVLLRVTVGDGGPLLCFDAAEITLSARSKLALRAPELSLEAERLVTQAASAYERIEHDQTVAVGGSRRTRIAEEERLEAGAIALQANDDGFKVRAMRRIDLDGEHIGVTDDRCPTAFPWSAAAEEGQTS